MPDDASRLLSDPGAGHLARTLADASSRGANPTEVLSAAIDYDTLGGVRSTCLVLASRIQDHPTTLGVPRTEPVDRPLPWLPAPNIGHPAWNEHLNSRARLIADRAHQLRSLANAYREQYQLTHLPNNDLGAPHPIGGQQRAAYQAVLRALDREVVPGARSEGRPGQAESLSSAGAQGRAGPKGPSVTAERRRGRAGRTTQP